MNGVGKMVSLFDLFVKCLGLCLGLCLGGARHKRINKIIQLTAMPWVPWVKSEALMRAHMRARARATYIHNPRHPRHKV